jgi:hypothetical protein
MEIKFMAENQEAHKRLNLEFDRRLLEDVLDTPDFRYVVLYMFFIRKEVFNDLRDDTLQDEFEAMVALAEPTVADLQKICSQELLKNLFNFNLIANIKSYEAFQTKPESFKVRLAEGLKLEHQSLSAEEEEVHIFMNEVLLERVITSKVPEITQVKIHAALERLRAMMCPRSAIVHQLVHKYGDFYVLDDDLFDILEQIGNPYQALRLELLIRAMVQKYKEIGDQINELLEQFDPELSKAEMQKKFQTAKEKEKTDYLDYLVEKSRKLSRKYNPKFPEGQTPAIYAQWKQILNELIQIRLDFNGVDTKLDKLRGYYSGKKQMMPYLSFIEKTSFDEDEIAEKVKQTLMDARNDLKTISDQIDKYDKKQLKLMNLDYERAVLELGEEDEEDSKPKKVKKKSTKKES